MRINGVIGAYAKPTLEISRVTTKSSIDHRDRWIIVAHSGTRRHNNFDQKPIDLPRSRVFCSRLKKIVVHVTIMVGRR